MCIVHWRKMPWKLTPTSLVLQVKPNNMNAAKMERPKNAAKMKSLANCVTDFLAHYLHNNHVFCFLK